jgi:Xaa-Pro dipeptidase
VLTTHTRGVPSPPFADFPRAEYESRVRMARQLMEESGIDLLVLWDPQNIRYFCGYQSLHWSAKSIQAAVYLLPLDADPLIIVPDFFADVVEGYTHLDDVRLIVKPHITKNIRGVPADVAGAVRQLGLGKARIGLESGWQGGMFIPRPLNDIDAFRDSLDGCTFVEAANVIWNCRVIKSPAEVAAIWTATEGLIAAYGEVVSQFELGMNERELSLMLHQAILKHTEECPPPMATSTSRPLLMLDVPSFYDQVTLTIGDWVVFEPMPANKGYWGSCCRVFHIGPFPDECLVKAELVDQAQEEAIKAVRPGIPTRQLIDVIEEVLHEGGIGSSLDMAGHGVGLTEHEPPMIAPEEEATLEEGMVMAIEVWVADEVGVREKKPGVIPDFYANEDLVVVTREGCDRLPSFRRDIRTLPYRGPLVEETSRSPNV